MQPKVSIVGAGPAGFALAADLERSGTNVLIYSHPTHLRHAGYVIKNGYLTASGIIQGSVSLKVTCDMSDVVHFSTTIILTVPSTGQETVLQEMKKFCLRQHSIIAIPGNLFALIADAEMEVGHIFETNLSPYSCRMNEGSLIVLGKKSRFFIASLEKDLCPTVKDKIQGIFPMELKWCSSVIEVSLLNVNGVFHPLMMLMNAGRIESTSGDFLLYHDGLTRSVANAMIAVDKVRIQIGEAFGLRLKSAIEVSNECYGHTFTDLVDLAQNSKPHNKLKAPADIENRNISEDVPDLLVSWHDLAEKLGIDASPIKAVIILAYMATGVDYMKTGRNLQKLHLEDFSRNELIERFSPISHGLRR
ncbi:hypothetical protein JX265_005639 [Neoarthrinium moseri]|uniref:NAD/NADP octopine/nopaline dehydrogenase n=1 Tax=Neoarthrinium moseri TaxID=1658444 RepID=A0A9P9WN69_9PEZI|nr:uncharacterized protein JN550_008378 [Neoarthrinium moseri]KAI1848735.1 hypothetical protein JX266_005594 [Neoarthrinium moseri]KAI1865330.1 hypothetical protein JN550_008378 [Neoarthrinium moseri]KAI1871653.1 hypothetical protein JX265_005639 [Neoarthrinium moseri]